jgi:hypothetical protein
MMYPKLALKILKVKNVGQELFGMKLYTIAFPSAIQTMEIVGQEVFGMKLYTNAFPSAIQTTSHVLWEHNGMKNCKLVNLLVNQQIIVIMKIKWKTLKQVNV